MESLFGFVGKECVSWGCSRFVCALGAGDGERVGCRELVAVLATPVQLSYKRVLLGFLFAFRVICVFSYAMLAADATQARSILTYKHDEDKITELTKSTMAAGAGEHGDRTAFMDYIQKNLALQELRGDVPLDTGSVAFYTRRQVRASLRVACWQTSSLTCALHCPFALASIVSLRPLCVGTRTTSTS